MKKWRSAGVFVLATLFMTQGTVAGPRCAAHSHELVILASKVAKRDRRLEEPILKTQVPSREDGQRLQILCLFHDPSDQDAGCRRIYAFADQAERELSGKIEVRRPDDAAFERCAPDCPGPLPAVAGLKNSS